MRRRHLFHVERRPVLSTPHGGIVHHGWDWVISHKLLVEFLIILTVGALIFAGSALIQTAPVRVVAPEQAGTVSLDPALHDYDAIEAIRAQRLINPLPTPDHSYDAIEAMRAERLVVQGDRSYDAVEAIRTQRLINPLPTPDHSYDAIELIRVHRDLNR